MKIKSLALSAMLAALYAALTIVLTPISFGPLQFRVSEALTLLPFYLPEAVPGLFAGCVLANFFGGYGMPDVIAGGGATLLAAWLSSKMPCLWLAALPPVVVNMFVIGTMLHLLIDNTPLWSTIIYVGLGQAGACWIVGYPLMLALEKRKILHR
ncbi:MAG: QueT transporter family protein [Synergistaceae bacterium]|jgi:uncharacterized membrane protein|nr:QueT transporter family protein [Synergistaceae bacterium]